MAIVKKTVYECDVCGKRSNKSDFNNGRNCGSAKLSLSGHYGVMSYDGSWGGASYSVENYE